MELEIQPSFMADALQAEAPVRKVLVKLIRAVERLNEQELRAHKGIHLHRIQNQSDPVSGLPIESMELTRSTRMKCLVEGRSLVLLSLHTDHTDHTDHDETYGKR